MSEKNKNWLIGGAIIAALLSMSIISKTMAPTNPTPPLATSTIATEPTAPPVGEEKAEAYRKACEFVKKRLKSPATAVFPKYYEPGASIEELPGGSFSVTGHVDSQNSYGATIRSEFTAKLKLVDNGATWKLENIDVVERQ